MSAPMAGVAVRIWRWGDAPEDLVALAPSTAMHDWLAWVPSQKAIEADDNFGWSDPQRSLLEDNSLIVVGNHVQATT